MGEGRGRGARAVGLLLHFNTYTENERRRRVHAGRATMPARTGKTTARNCTPKYVSQIAGSPNPRARMNRCAAKTATPRPASRT